MSDDRAHPVLLGLAVRLRAVEVADQARAVGSCGHPGARFCSALAPEAGAWCVACGAAHMGDLLVSPWCVMCDDFARPGLTAARAERLEVLVRVCGHCLTRDDTPEPTP
ncbi:hypothetical protein ABZT02_44970 [Streptomyces sp. NPDC005402]|uniref:hypothetical protein n=1 Tax=Streptomyces sp. NPDC005402 TaxID=3155338 RepID=UPI0033B0612F